MIDQEYGKESNRENPMNTNAKPRHDEAMFKGAMEDDAPPGDAKDGQRSRPFAGQLGHRDQDEMLKDNDTDFPEPDAKAEITGK
jgi:hypothetical protein